MQIGQRNGTGREIVEDGSQEKQPTMRPCMERLDIVSAQLAEFVQVGKLLCLIQRK